MSIVLRFYLIKEKGQPRLRVLFRRKKMAKAKLKDENNNWLRLVVWILRWYSFNSCFLRGVIFRSIVFIRFCFTTGECTITCGGHLCNIGRDCSSVICSRCHILKMGSLVNLNIFLLKTWKSWCSDYILSAIIHQEHRRILTANVRRGARSRAGNMREMVNVWWCAVKLKSFSLSWKVYVFPTSSDSTCGRSVSTWALRPTPCIQVTNILIVSIGTSYSNSWYLEVDHRFYHNLCSFSS